MKVKKIIIDAGIPKSASSGRQSFFRSSRAEEFFQSQEMVYLDNVKILGYSCDDFHNILINGSDDSLKLFVYKISSIDQNILISHEGICLIPLPRLIYLIQLLNLSGFTIVFRLFTREFIGFLPSWYRQAGTNDNLTIPLYKNLLHIFSKGPEKAQAIYYPAFQLHIYLKSMAQINQALRYSVSYYNEDTLQTDRDICNYITGDNPSPFLTLTAESAQVVNASESLLLTHVRCFLNWLRTNNNSTKHLSLLALYKEFFGSVRMEDVKHIEDGLIKTMDYMYSVEREKNLTNSIGYFFKGFPSRAAVSEFVSKIVCVELNTPRDLQDIAFFELLKLQYSKADSFHMFITRLRCLINCGERHKDISKNYPNFDPVNYLMLNADVFYANVNAYDHYVDYGIRENRKYIL